MLLMCYLHYLVISLYVDHMLYPGLLSLGLTTVGSTVKKKYTTRHCAPVNIEYALAEPTDTMHHLGAR